MGETVYNENNEVHMKTWICGSKTSYLGVIKKLGAFPGHYGSTNDVGIDHAFVNLSGFLELITRDMKACAAYSGSFNPVLGSFR